MSKKEMEKLVDENRVLSQRLSDVEFELSKKEENLKTANQRKSELLSDLRDYQCKFKNLQGQLERAESAEMEAKGMAHNTQQALEAAEASLKDKTASSKAAVNSLQLTINNLKAKLAEKEDKCDSLAASLQLKEELVSGLSSDKARSDKDTASRLANLNQALAKAKQSCSQLKEELETHKAREWELAQRVEDLELAAAAGAGTRDAKATPSKALKQKESVTLSGTPIAARTRAKPGSSVVGGSGIFMPAANSELDSLRAENKKLKQDLSCLQTNFELTSRKSSQLRAEAKEAESALSELREQFDRNLAEKEELQVKYDQLAGDLRGRRRDSSQEPTAERRQVLEFTKQMESLRSELESLQRENSELRDQLRSGQDRSRETQGMLERLDSVKQSLSEEKSAMHGEMEALQGELEHLQERCRDLEDSSSAHREEKRKGLSTIKALKAKILKLGREKAELSDQLVTASEKLEQAQDKIQLHADEVKALEVDLKAKEKENAVLSTQRQDQAHVPVEMEKLRVKVVETLDEMKELRGKNEGLQSVRERLEGKVAQLSKANAKLVREGRHASELTLKVNAELEKMEERVQALESDLDAEQRNHASTKSKLAQARRELSEVSNGEASHKAEVEKLLERLGETEQANFELAAELAGCRKEAGVARETRSDAEQKLMQLEERLDAAEFALLERDSRLSDLNCAYELMQAENSTLLSQVTSLSEMVSARNFKLEAQQAHSAQHETEYLEIVANISRLETEHGNCAGVIDGLRESGEALRASLEEAEVGRREAEGTVSALRHKVAELEKSVADLESGKRDLEERLEAQAGRHTELSEKYATSESRVHRLELDLRAESLALSSARDDLRQTKKVHDEARAEMTERVEAMEQKLADTEVQLTSLHRERVELKSRVLDLRAELKEQVLLTSSLKIQRDSLGEQYESLKESALSVLQSDTILDSTVSLGEENAPATSPKGKGKGKGKATRGEVRGILKKPNARKVLHPVQNL